MDLGNRIAAWRKARGMSQGELARAVGITRAAVSQWEDTDEKVKTSPSQAHLALVVAALKTTMVEFYGPLPKVKRGAKAA